MLTIAALGTIAVFILLLAVAKASGLLTAGVDLSARVQQYRTPVRQQRRARVSTGSAFWDDIMRSRFSIWARTGANKFGYLLPKKNWFELKAQQANLPVTGQEYMMLVGGSALFIFVLMAIATLQLSEPLLFAVGWVVFASLYVQFKANRRMKQFTNQLGDAIAMMSNAIKSGFTFQQAMDIVAKEINGPISEEFVRALNEIQLGVTLEEALEGICQRIKDDDPDLIRYLIAPDGYVEGWATYCELFSYSYADTGNPLLNTLAQANYATILCLYAKCDLGINALGWTENDVASYIADFGFTDKNVAHEMYLSMVSNPGNYCKYVLGWIGFSELKKEARAQTGSAFSNPDFHKYILDMGSVPFDMLFDRLEDWCSVQSAQ